MSEWIDVKQELPPITGVCDASTDEVLVLLKRDYAPDVTVGFYDYGDGDGGHWYLHHHMLKSSEVIAWQPLPDRKFRPLTGQPGSEVVVGRS